MSGFNITDRMNNEWHWMQYIFEVKWESFLFELHGSPKMSIWYKGINTLYWGRVKMTAFWQTPFTYALSCMKTYEFRLIFHWILFLWVQLKYSSISSYNGLAMARWQDIIWTSDRPIYWHASLDPNELSKSDVITMNYRCNVIYFSY